MSPIGAMMVAAAAGLGDLPAHLPWGWFGALGLADAVLVGVAARRRRHPDLRAPRVTPALRRPARADAVVVRSGWRVPRSRVIGLPTRQATYAWPLHSEYMVSRLA